MLYDTLNEPSYISWEAWRPVAEELTDVVLANNPKAITLVSGANWSHDLSGALTDPVNRDNIVYEVHAYPHNSNPNGATWQDTVVQLSQNSPVIIGEWGFNEASSQSHLQGGIDDYAIPLVELADENSIGWMSFIYSQSWVPRLVEYHIGDTERLSDSGCFIKEVLNGRPYPVSKDVCNDSDEIGNRFAGIDDTLLSYTSLNYIANFDAGTYHDIIIELTGLTYQGEALDLERFAFKLQYLDEAISVIALELREGEGISTTTSYGSEDQWGKALSIGMIDATYLTVTKLNELTDQDLRIIKKILTNINGIVSAALTSNQIDEATKLLWKQRLVNIEIKAEELLSVINDYGNPVIADTAPPVISLNGESQVNIELGSVYSDPGAAAHDDVDGSVIVSTQGLVDTSTYGSYTLTYTAVDKSNNSSSETRIVNVIHKVVLDIATTSSGKPVTKVIGSNQEVVDFEEGIIFESNNDSGSLMLALNDEETLEYLAYVDNTIIDEISIGPNSTAFSLIMLLPSIVVEYQKNQAIIGNLINTNPEVLALAEAIQNTPSWSEMTDASLIQNYSDALLSVLLRIKELSAQQNTTSTASSGNMRSLSIVVDQGDGEEPVRSGVELVANGENDPTADEPKFSIQVQNNYSRWISVLVGDKGDDGKYPGQFEVPPNSSYSSTPYPSEPIPKNKNDVYPVVVVGPGFSGFTGSFSSEEKTAYLKATVFTLLDQVAIPTVSIITGSGDCISGLYSPLNITHGFFDGVLKSSKIQNMANSNNGYQEAGLELVSVLLSSIVDSSVGCLSTTAVKKVAEHLYPILGQLTLLMTAGELALELAPVALDFSRSKVYEAWDLQNLLDAEASIDSENYVAQAGHGLWGYTYASDITSEWSDLYTGACPYENHRRYL